jgi:hypothetical protein
MPGLGVASALLSDAAWRYSTTCMAICKTVTVTVEERVVGQTRPPSAHRESRGWRRGPWTSEVTFGVGLFDLSHSSLCGRPPARDRPWRAGQGAGAVAGDLRRAELLVGYLAYPLGASENRVALRRRERRPRQAGFRRRVGRDYVRRIRSYCAVRGGSHTTRMSPPR